MTTSSPSPEFIKAWTDLIDDRPEDGVFRVHRDVFLRPDLFDLEMRLLFESGWVFLAHTSQIAKPHDYLTVIVGRHPLVIMRDGDGRIGAFFNSCRHKGAQVCHHRRGNARVHVCQYHSWSYDSTGRSLAIKARAQGGYSAAFDQDSHGLQPIAALGEYRGFLFGSLGKPSLDLDQHLGDIRHLLDLVVDQSPDGIELVPGDVRYSFRANWKFQLENTVDAYHFASTHASYLGVMNKRAERERTVGPAAVPGAASGAVASLWQGEDGVKLEDRMGAFTFEPGHALVWTTSPPERHPLFPQYDTLKARLGKVRSDWMLRTRQLGVFPNLQIGSSAAIQMRVIRPLAVDLTEISTFCIAPVGESSPARRQRLRQYEDFFNPSGLATPDDTVNYEDCQRAMQSGGIEWQQGYARGMSSVRPGADVFAAELALSPATSMSGDFAEGDETVFHGIYRAWLRRLQDGTGHGF
jgi:benzoate/toluate 1,2-dioxygenase subunit alpha